MLWICLSNYHPWHTHESGDLLRHELLSLPLQQRRLLLYSAVQGGDLHHRRQNSLKRQHLLVRSVQVLWGFIQLLLTQYLVVRPIQIVLCIFIKLLLTLWVLHCLNRWCIVGDFNFAYLVALLTSLPKQSLILAFHVFQTKLERLSLLIQSISRVLIECHNLLRVLADAKLSECSCALLCTFTTSWLLIEILEAFAYYSIRIRFIVWEDILLRMMMSCLGLLGHGHVFLYLSRLAIAEVRELVRASHGTLVCCFWWNHYVCIHQLSFDNLLG